MSALADLTFRALIVSVDDFGRMDARPSILKATLFPARDEITTEHIEGFISELVREECVVLYTVDGDRFLYLVNWEEHRGKSRRPTKSKLPSPDEGVITPVNKRTATQCNATQCSETAPGRGVGEEREKERKEEDSGEAPTDRAGLHTEDSHHNPDPDAIAPLVNLLAKLDGEGDEKRTWLEYEYTKMLIDAEASRDGPKPKTVKQLVIPYYRTYLRGQREFCDHAAKQRAKERAKAWGEKHGADYDAEQVKRAEA